MTAKMILCASISTALILDMDSSVSETYGHQEGTAYNGHFGCTCYHPLFLFNQFGDLERVMLRRGNHLRELRKGEASGAPGSGRDGGGYRRRYFGENRCSSSRGWVNLTAGVELEAPGEVHLGKIGCDTCALA